MMKIKRVRTIDAVVAGWRPGKEPDTVGSLILGLYDDAGKLHIVGHSSGLKAAEKRALVGKLAPYETGERGHGDPSRWQSERELEWISLRPELVVEVTFDHASGGRIRHGTKILRWREDKASVGLQARADVEHAVMDADAIVVGGGLAGLVATAELADAGRRVILLDQEPEASLGGQAFWSFGGPVLRRQPRAAARRASRTPPSSRCRTGWAAPASTAPRTPGRAGGPRPTSSSPPARSAPWLYDQGVRFFPTPGWAERGGYLATGHGNSVPRFHITWGTGPGLIEPFERRVREGVARGQRRP